MKRKSLDVQKQVFEAIKQKSPISMSSLERLIGTNPTSLKEHCEQLEWLGLVKIEKKENTTLVCLNCK